MKYLSVIYYDTFARFFLKIEESVKEISPDAEFLHLAIFPSGYLYLKFRGARSVLLPSMASKFAGNAVGVPDDEVYEVVRYHAAISGNEADQYIDELYKRGRKYIEAMEYVVTTYRPDVVIFSGDSRLACEALKYQLDRCRSAARRYYFEQGPTGTTIFDTEGVNANCSFRQALAGLTGDGFENVQLKRRKRYKRNQFYRGMDYLSAGVLRCLRRLPPEWKTMPLSKCRIDLYENAKTKKFSMPVLPEVLIALQVPDDANNIHHNPLGVGDVEMLEMALNAIKGLDLVVCVREHPLYRRKYSEELYRILADTTNAYLSNDNLDSDLARAKLVVTVNSMTGLDAYLKSKAVVVLGNAYYDCLPGIARVSNASSLRECIEREYEKIENENAKGGGAAAIFGEMRSKFLVDGHYLDKELVAPGHIARIICGER